jgi:hypothetical protein
MNREKFNTLAEAEAFIQGIEYCDNDHVSTEGPEVDVDEDGQVCFNVYITEAA